MKSQHFLVLYCKVVHVSKSGVISKYFVSVNVYSISTVSSLSVEVVNKIALN